MSEYQYYEFVAIDEPLTAAQMRELRSRSSRAVITPTSFINEYNWGDLKGDPIDWMRRYFDAHIYIANWCSCWLFLRTPKDAFEARTLNAFETEYAFTVDWTKSHWILEWELSEGQDYDRFGEEDGRGWMGRLVSLRDELLRGDLRPLYLGWLAGMSAGEIDEEAIEPPPPPGLSRLTAAQQALVEFLEIDRDLLAAAAFSDKPQSDCDVGGDAYMKDWIAGLPDKEGRVAIKQLLMGRAQQAERQMKSRFLAWQREQRPDIETSPMRRTVAVLRDLAKSAAETRKRQETIQRRKAEAKRQAARELYLRTLANDFDRCWMAVYVSAERGIASAYNDVKRALVDLADAYALCSTRAEFDRRLAQFMSRHRKRGALVRRLVESGLWKNKL